MVDKTIDNEGLTEGKKADSGTHSNALPCYKPPSPAIHTWEFIKHNPTVIVLGKVAGNQVVDIKAVIERNSDGSWKWKHLPDSHFQGVEPSASEAMKAVITAYGL